MENNSIPVFSFNLASINKNQGGLSQLFTIEKPMGFMRLIKFQLCLTLSLFIPTKYTDHPRAITSQPIPGSLSHIHKKAILKEE